MVEACLPISRADARKYGATRYSTKVPCARGHLSPRFTANRRCVECQHEYVVGPGAPVRAQWSHSAAGRQAVKRGRKRYKASEKGRAADRAWRLNSLNVRDQARMQNAKRDGHPPPPKEVDCPLRPLDNRCQCCHEVQERRLHLDHSHQTGAFQGWVCHGCNTGTLRPDNIKWLHQRIVYLEKVSG
jgi:hypothetical protein